MELHLNRMSCLASSNALSRFSCGLSHASSTLRLMTVIIIACSFDCQLVVVEPREISTAKRVRRLGGPRYLSSESTQIEPLLSVRVAVVVAA